MPLDTLLVYDDASRREPPRLRRAIDRRLPLPFCFVSLCRCNARRRPFLLLSWLSAPMSARKSLTTGQPPRWIADDDGADVQTWGTGRGTISPAVCSFLAFHLSPTLIIRSPDLYLFSPLNGVSIPTTYESMDTRGLFVNIHRTLKGITSFQIL